MPATTIKPAAPATVLSASAQTISRRRLLTAAGSAALGAALTPKPVRAAAVGSKTLRIAALPAIDALILYAAEADGIFKAEGLNIEILPFKSSVEMTAAIRAEKIIGQYANILGTIAQRANGIGLSLAATTWHTSPAQRAFGFAVSPKFADQITSIEVLKGLTGVSSTRSRGTIIDWMIYRMKNAVNLPEKTLDQIEVAQIPIRLQMLLTGKMQTALFYEPLLTLIESKGGRVIWDDRQLNEPLSEVALTTPYLTPDFVLPFRAALAKAAKAIDQDPQKYVPILSKKGLVPPLPTDTLVQEAADWLVKVGILNQAPDITGTICRL
ncbi:ABC transporter substrate-binding protein [Sutterella wadsworthensis]|uniref:ABC transporter substrate-binding protein n=1 Tax=Sutterella wadsworthensis TaxID=40545 RepID=UPI0024311D2B|nr:ABC transporter substrate-binding protein [Sutterella wadsworthensis]